MKDASAHVTTTVTTAASETTTTAGRTTALSETTMTATRTTASDVPTILTDVRVLPARPYRTGTTADSTAREAEMFTTGLHHRTESAQRQQHRRAAHAAHLAAARAHLAAATRSEAVHIHRAVAVRSAAAHVRLVAAARSEAVHRAAVAADISADADNQEKTVFNHQYKQKKGNLRWIGFPFFCFYVPNACPTMMPTPSAQSLASSICFCNSDICLKKRRLMTMPAMMPIAMKMSPLVRSVNCQRCASS